MTVKIKKARGRPKVEAEAKRSLSLPPIKVNEVERIRIEARAQAAGVNVSAWVRYAAQEINPPERRIIPPVNQEIWLQLGEDLNLLRCLEWRFKTDGETMIVEALKDVEHRLKALRNELIGARL